MNGHNQQSDEMVRAVLAAVSELDAGSQHQLLQGLQRLLQHEDMPANSAPTKRARAIAALVEAAALADEGRLSYDRYRALRVETDERRLAWPAAMNITRWLGVAKWNDALREARLDAMPDGDFVVRQLGPQHKLTELVAAVQECAKEIGVPPSFGAYVAWARRADVQARPGRRAMSQHPFTRYGGFLEVLREAGLIERSGSQASLRGSGLIRSAGYFVSDEELRRGLNEVVSRLKRSPRVSEYQQERQRIFDETSAEGAPRAIPSYNTFRSRHGGLNWDEILMHYDLEPLGGRHTGAKTGPKGPTGPRVDRDEMLSVLREAWEAHGRKLTVEEYRKWRVSQTMSDRSQGVLRRIPDYTSYWTHFETWDKALKAAAALATPGGDA